MDTGPGPVSIMRQGPYLIASIYTALDDAELVEFQRDLLARIGVHGSRGVVIDVAGLDVIDSFGFRTLADIAEMARLRGAPTTLIGIQPDVAFTVVELGVGTRSPSTAVDLEDAWEQLTSQARITAAVGHRDQREPQADRRPKRSSKKMVP